MRLLLATLSIALAVSPASAQSVDRKEINRIIDQAFNHSEVMETAAYLTDRIGARLTNSPQMREAEKWTQAKFRDWGLSNVHAEPFEFGRGWSINQSSARMIAPRIIELRAIPVAWTPPTNGTISAGIVVAPIAKESDFDQWRGKLSGKIVLVSHPGTGSEPGKAPFQRWSNEDLDKLDTYSGKIGELATSGQTFDGVVPPMQAPYSPVAVEKKFKEADFSEKQDAFLKAEGALAWVRMASRDGGLVYGEGYNYRMGRTPALPGIEMAAEDYRRLARLAKTDAPPTLELMSDVRFHDEDVNAYNVIAEIPGTDPRAGYVMAGAHLDSWVASDGAQDNAAGNVVVMEAARILKTLGVRPKRTIRFALWSGEEQGLLGSRAYTERYLATLAPVTDPKIARLRPNISWPYRWPITPKAGHDDLVAYFNLDNGSGKIRGIYAENNVAIAPIFQEWLAPFASMGASTVSLRNTLQTDHVPMQTVGVPGYQFIQDSLDYWTRIHHSSIDSYDHLKAEDLRQAAAIMASFLLNAANRNEPLPRMPIPTQPRQSDPFEYPAQD